MVQLSRPRWRIAAIATSLLVTLVLVPAAPASAHDDHPMPSGPTVVASGLNNPRHLRFSGGALYVAEAGVGGSGPCVIPLPGGSGFACYGASGSITRVKNGRQSRVVKGLPSVAAASGEEAIGAADVRVRGHRFTVVLGLAANPALRAQLPGAGKKLATVSTGRFGHKGLHVVADIGAYEAAANPDGGAIDTDPVALLHRGRRDFIVDAGGNTLLRTRRGHISTRAVFPDVLVDAPAFLGLPPGTKIPMQAVPTAAVTGPDGAIYVSQLTGFPFPVGAASIWRLEKGKAPTMYATGLTDVTDLAFAHDGSLYAVQIADAGLLAPPVGSVVHIPAGGGAMHETLISNLTAPYGIALRGHSAYVTTGSTLPGKGEVLRIPLHHESCDCGS